MDQTEDRGSCETPSAKSGVIRGRVLDTNGAAVVGAVVRALAVDLRNEFPMKPTRSHADGSYEVAYTSSRVEPRGAP